MAADHENLLVEPLKVGFPPRGLNLDGAPSVTGQGRQFQLVHQIGRAIVGGIFHPGTRLPSEADMLKQYAVSRTALREAYSMLTAKGLIKARPKVGTHVRAKSEWNMFDPDILTWHLQAVPTKDIATDLYALRRMIEPDAAALAAVNRSEQALQQISQAYEDMQTFGDGGSELINADFRFHISILSATGNRFIGAFSGIIRAAMQSTFKLSWMGAALIQEDRLGQHGAVLDAIGDGDPQTASKCMDALLDTAIADLHDALMRGSDLSSA